MATRKTTPKRRKAKTPAQRKAERTNAILRRQARVAQFSLAYVPQAAIALELGVSKATISNDMKTIRQAWLEDAKTDIQTALVRELGSLDRLESRLWTQFGSGKAITNDERTRTALAILRTKERRAKLLGFDQPDLLEVTISDERLVYEVEQLRVKLGYDGPKALPA